MHVSPKTVVAIGFHDPHGARYAVIKRGLREHGYVVSECRTVKRGLIAKYHDLTREYRAIRRKPDVLLVPFPGHYIMPLAKALVFRSKIPIVYDFFTSLYDSDVLDRKRFSPFHQRAWISFFMDWLGPALANIVLTDTEEHRQYFASRYCVPPEKMIVVPVGCRTDIFKKCATAGTGAPHRGVPGGPPGRPYAGSKAFTVEFHGTFVPLQGVETILRAAKELQDRNETVRFELIGRGQTYGAMRALASSLQLMNVDFAGFQPMERVANAVRRADVCLGIFGTSGKADRVIPTKAYEALACGKPLITGRTSAAERVFRHRENAMLIAPGDPAALAACILELKNNPKLRTDIAVGGHATFCEQFQSAPAVFSLVKRLEEHGLPPP